jgi:tetrapyrrole methylase family protein/MazG family protein
MSGAEPRLVVVGLGPGSPDLRTVGTQRALDTADRIILRTRIHPGLDDLLTDSRVSDCDDLYQSATAFASLYDAVAERVLTVAREGGTTVFAVPGHPRFAEQTVALIERHAGERGIPVDVLDAVSFVDTVANAARIDPVASGLQIVDAEELGSVLEREPYAAGLLGVDPARALLVAQLYNREIAAAVKLALSRVYPDEHPVTLLQGVGAGVAVDVSPHSLHTLDRQEVDHLTSLWVPPLPPLDATRSAETLPRIVARLRAPRGCPWDREQTHASLRGAILEEAYETVDAIDQGDDAGLAEELGDLLLLVVMHAQIAEEAGVFQIEDVYDAINRKLVRRHPHVFGDVTATTPDAVITTWEGVKAAERAEKGTAATERSRYDRLPRAMPALRKAVELVAPRETLGPAPRAAAGAPLLAEVLDLIAEGYDPEATLELAVRQHAVELEQREMSIATTGMSNNEEGRE